MADERTQKINVRRAHRATVTKTLDKVKDMLSQPVIELAQLKQKRSALVEKIKVLKGLDSEIINTVEQENLEHEIEQGESYQEKIELAIIEIDQVINGETALTRRVARTTPPPIEPPVTDLTETTPEGELNTTGDTTTEQSAGTTPPTDHTDAPPPASDPAHPIPTQETATRVKLPEIALPKFYGDITHWHSFWDSFESAIHCNPVLSDVDKFKYLSSLLDRSAAEAINGLSLTAANYVEAVAILKKRFGNKQLIISRHMELLMKLDSVGSGDVKAVRRLIDKVETNVRALNSLGVKPESYGSLLSSVLMSKLPPELRLIVTRNVPEDEWQINTLLELLEREISARERSQSGFNQHRPPHHRRPASSTTNLMQGQVCVYCNESHSSSSCKKISSVDARRSALKTAGRCYICLRKGHISRNCRSGVRCPNCNNRHDQSICYKEETTSKVEPPATLPTPISSGNSTHVSYANVKTPVLLQTAQVSAYNPDHPELTTQLRLILDSGSQRSYVTYRVRKELSLKPSYSEQLVIKTFGNTRKQVQTCDVVMIGIKTKDGTPLVLPLLSVPFICEPLVRQPVICAKEAFDHLKSLELADPSCEEEQLELDILIGSDHYWKLVTGGVRRGDSGPTAIETKVGWVLSGPIGDPGIFLNLFTMNTVHSLLIDEVEPPTQAIDAQLEKFWDLETMGIRETPSVHDKFIHTVCFKEGRYEVQLPWRDNYLELTDNLEQSRKRLIGLFARLRQRPELLKEYDTIIREQLSKGIIETADLSSSDRTHYIPHHAVIRADKSTTKIRIVYDASAKGDNGVSLNDCLHKGPKFDQNIFDLLLRFRTHKIAFTADIEKAFLMISISERDRDVLRFLWVNDIHKTVPEIVHFRFTRVVFGVTASPFLLNATLQYHLEKHRAPDTDLVDSINRLMYVDNVISGAQDENKAHLLYKRAKTVFQEGGFKLRKFISNSPPLNSLIQNEETAFTDTSGSRIAPDDLSYAKAVLGNHKDDMLNEHRVLGILWNTTADTFVFDLRNIAHIASDLSPTKRTVVSTTAKFFDPLGFISPITIKFKTLFQLLCKQKLSWDEILPPFLQENWHRIIAEIAESDPVIIDRYYLGELSCESSNIHYSIHGFCEASSQAYAAVLYLKVETPTDRRVCFLASKTRVAPLSAQTIPRLELLSALLLARLIVSVTTALNRELQLSTPTCYTDSKIALCWIKGVRKEWKQFIENRVLEIRRLVEPNHWKHCSGIENPADIPTRGMSPHEFKESSMWWNGPPWLLNSDPLNCDISEEEVEDCMLEVKGHEVISLLTKENHSNIASVVSCSRFSDLHKLIRVTAHVLEFVRRLKKLPISPSKSELLLEAELHWLKECQSSLGTNPNYRTWETQFGLYSDERGLIRCRGRLVNANIPYDTKHPILLDTKHRFCELIVRDCHEKVKHNGVRETLTQVRVRFWIIKGRSFIRKLINQCTICRKLEGLPYKLPPSPPLPSFRVNQAPPFSFTGIDFAGPVFVKSREGTECVKVWICLYTCCVTRAVHLDVVEDLNTSTFLNSFRRFSSRRGFPTCIVSDNAKTFKSAASILRGLVSRPEVQRYFSELRITWNFNLEKAPWWGGFFERLIKSVKRCLRKTLGRASLTHDEFLTALTEVEMVINSRPLSVSCTDDFEEPLTPSHLLTGRRILSLPSHVYPSDPDFQALTRQGDLNKRMKHFETILSHFWKRWQSEYLTELRECHRHSGINHNPDPTPPRVGDVVLIHDSDVPRGLWKMAIVQEVICGNDDKARGAILRVHSKDGKLITLRRSIRHLYPLEIQAQSTPVESTTPDDPPQNTHRNSTRAAARAARQNIQNINEYESDCEFDIQYSV